MPCEAEAETLAQALENARYFSDIMGTACAGADPQDPNCRLATAGYYDALAKVAIAQAELEACQKLAEAPRVRTAEGMITFLRAHRFDTGWGRAPDRLEAEVIFRLDSRPDKAFGFPLRNGEYLPAHEAMLSLLRDALIHDLRVHVEFLESPEAPNANCVAIRVWIEKRYTDTDANLGPAGVTLG